MGRLSRGKKARREREVAAKELGEPAPWTDQGRQGGGRCDAAITSRGLEEFSWEAFEDYCHNVLYGSPVSTSSECPRLSVTCNAS